NDLDEHLPRREAFLDLLPDDLTADRLDERFHDWQRNVGLEQSHAHLSQGVVDVVLGEPAAAAQALDDTLQTLRQFVEHREITIAKAERLSLRAYGGNSYSMLQNVAGASRILHGAPRFPTYRHSL